MAKQTMAFSSQAINFRADQKLYHLQVSSCHFSSSSSSSFYLSIIIIVIILERVEGPQLTNIADSILCVVRLS